MDVPGSSNAPTRPLGWQTSRDFLADWYDKDEAGVLTTIFNQALASAKTVAGRDGASGQDLGDLVDIAFPDPAGQALPEALLTARSILGPRELTEALPASLSPAGALPVQGDKASPQIQTIKPSAVESLAQAVTAPNLAGQTASGAFQADPAQNPLFQSHSGASGTAAVTRWGSQTADLSAELASMRVEGIGGTADGSFAGARFLSSGSGLAEVEPDAAKQTAPIPFALLEEMSATYSRAQVAAARPRPGTSLDVEA